MSSPTIWSRLPEGGGQMLPSLPVVLGTAVLDRYDRIAAYQGLVVTHDPIGIERLALAGEHVLAVLEELAGRGVERERHVLARTIAGFLAGLGDEAQRLVRRLQVRREAALVADIGVVAGIMQALLQRGEDLRAHADAVGHRARTDRLDHEFLDVDRIVGMHAAVDDVHHRHRQRARIDAADMAIQRDAQVLRRGLRDSQRHRQDRVGAETRLVRGAVEVDQDFVDLHLVGRVQAADRIEDLAFDIADRCLHALAAEPLGVVVAQLHRLVRAGRGPGGHGGATHGATVEHHVGFDRGIAAAVEYLAGKDVGNGGHGTLRLLLLASGFDHFW